MYVTHRNKMGGGKENTTYSRLVIRPLCQYNLTNRRKVEKIDKSHKEKEN